MKKLIFAFVMLQSCSSQENKIEKAIRQIETQNLEADHATVEKLEIDSLEYSQASMQLYYLTKQVEYLKIADELRETRRTLYNLYGDNPSDSVKRADLLLKIQAGNAERDKISHALDSLYKRSDTAKKIYEVNYVLKVATDKEKSTDRKRRFLTKDSLKVLSMGVKEYL